MKVTNEERNEKIATKAKDILGSKPLIAICAVIIAGNLAYPSISKLVTAKENNKVISNIDATVTENIDKANIFTIFIRNLQEIIKGDLKI